MHKSKSKLKPKGRGPVGKDVVMGFLERDGAVVAKVVPGVDKDTLVQNVKDNIEEGSMVYTDSATAYRELSQDNDRFRKALANIGGKRLTYKRLIGKTNA